MEGHRCWAMTGPRVGRGECGAGSRGGRRDQPVPLLVAALVSVSERILVPLLVPVVVPVLVLFVPVAVRVRAPVIVVVPVASSVRGEQPRRLNPPLKQGQIANLQRYDVSEPVAVPIPVSVPVAQSFVLIVAVSVPVPVQTEEKSLPQLQNELVPVPLPVMGPVRTPVLAAVPVLVPVAPPVSKPVPVPEDVPIAVTKVNVLVAVAAVPVMLTVMLRVPGPVVPVFPPAAVVPPAVAFPPVAMVPPAAAEPPPPLPATPPLASLPASVRGIPMLEQPPISNPTTRAPAAQIDSQQPECPESILRLLVSSGIVRGSDPAFSSRQGCAIVVKLRPERTPGTHRRPATRAPPRHPPKPPRQLAIGPAPCSTYPPVFCPAFPAACLPKSGCACAPTGKGHR